MVIFHSYVSLPKGTDLPSGKLLHMERSTIFHGKIHHKWAIFYRGYKVKNPDFLGFCEMFSWDDRILMGMYRMFDGIL